MGWRGWLLEIPEAGFRGRSDSRVKWEGSIALGWLDWGCMGVLAGGAPVMNRVFDYLRLALKGRTKTLGQRLRASQLSYRMLGPVFLPPLPDLNTTVAFSILVTEAHIHHITVTINFSLCFCLHYANSQTVYATLLHRVSEVPVNVHQSEKSTSSPCCSDYQDVH